MPPKPIPRFVFPKLRMPLWVWYALLVSLKLWLTRGLLVFAIGPATYDDRLFVTLANHLAGRAWLGPYNSFTLIKGPFFPLWLAVMSVAGIPLLLSVQVLYALACGALVRALRSLLRSDVARVASFGLLLYNPSSNVIQRVVRDSLYTPLVVLVMAGACGLLLSVMEPRRNVWRWATGLGLALGCLWLTREEGVWVLPFMTFAAVAGVVWAYRAAPNHLARYAGAWGLALGLPVFMVWGVSAVNHHYYGVFTVSEMDVSSFKAAYGAVARVKPTERKPRVSVTKETRFRIYQVSPAFREVEPFMEGPVQSWVAHGGLARTERNQGEILGGWFVWAFRDAVSLAGHYDHGRYPEAYYARLAQEVNAACESGQLECYAGRATLVPVWQWEYVGPIMRDMGSRLLRVMWFQKLEMRPIQSQGPKDSLGAFRDVTHEETMGPDETAETLPRQQAWRLKRYAALNMITQLYQWSMPLLIVTSIMAYVWSSVRWLRERGQPGWWLTQTALFLLLVPRLFIIAMIHTTSWMVPGVGYLSCAHAVVLTFVALAVGQVADQISPQVPRPQPQSS